MKNAEWEKLGMVAEERKNDIREEFFMNF